jgi:hypothetical protein
MSVNVLRIEGTDTTGTIVSGLRVPTEPQADAFEVDILPEPQPSPLFMYLQPQQSSAHAGTSRAPVSNCVVIWEPKAVTYSRHAGGMRLISNTTVTSSAHHTHHWHTAVDLAMTIPRDLFMMISRTILSNTEQGPPFRATDLQEESSEALADYDAYAVGNWDGYEAQPITSETLRAARTILRSLPETFGDPVSSPGPDGSIVFEWLKEYGPLCKLFIDIGPGRTWKAYWRVASGKTGTVPRKPITISTIPELQKLFETLLHG